MLSIEIRTVIIQVLPLSYSCVICCCKCFLSKTVPKNLDPSSETDLPCLSGYKTGFFCPSKMTSNN